MNPNCKIGKVTPRGNVALLPRQDEDIGPFVEGISEFAEKNGVSAFGFYVCGGGQTAIGFTGGVMQGISAVDLLKHKLAKEWWQ